MNEEIEFVLDSAKELMDKAIRHFESELAKIRAGKANVFMLEPVKVEYYGSLTPLSQVANVSTPDARTITVQPWEKNLLDDITKAIINANLGLNPQNNGEMIIINIPVLTEERRRELVKKSKNEGENCRVSLRNARKDANDAVKTLVKDGLSEDMGKGVEADIQKLTDSYVTKTEAILADKEKDIMTL